MTDTELIAKKRKRNYMISWVIYDIVAVAWLIGIVLSYNGMGFHPVSMTIAFIGIVTLFFTMWAIRKEYKKVVAEDKPLDIDTKNSVNSGGENSSNEISAVTDTEIVEYSSANFIDDGFNSNVKENR